MKEFNKGSSKRPGQVFFEKMSNPEVIRENLKTAIEKSLSKGIPVVQEDEKGVFKLHTDGTKEYIAEFKAADLS